MASNFIKDVFIKSNKKNHRWFEDQHGLSLVQARKKTEASENSSTTKCLEVLDARSKRENKNQMYN